MQDILDRVALPDDFVRAVLRATRVAAADARLAALDDPIPQTRSKRSEPSRPVWDDGTPTAALDYGLHRLRDATLREERAERAMPSMSTLDELARLSWVGGQGSNGEIRAEVWQWQHPATGELVTLTRNVPVTRGWRVHPDNICRECREARSVNGACACTVGDGSRVSAFRAAGGE